MEYEIKGGDSIYYTPAVEEWIYKTFDFNVQEAMLYKIILQKKFCTWSQQYLATILRTSRSTIVRLLKRFLDMNIIIQEQVKVSGSKTRVVTIALYDKAGRIKDEAIESYKRQGIKKVLDNENIS